VTKALEDGGWWRAVALAALLCISAPWASWAQDTSTDVEGEPLDIVEEPKDPLESINRSIFYINNELDILILRPVARAYLDYVPRYARARVGDMRRNLGTPLTAVNDVLQGQFERAGTAVSRFAINVLIGFGGFFDVADRLGLEHHREDLGQTLAVWGVDSGPYLVIPLFGPTTVRDFAADFADGYISPLGYVIPSYNEYAKLGVKAVTTVHARASTLDETEALESTSLDFYSAVRSLYFQNRDYEIRNGEPLPPSDLFEDIDNGK
jgi:phospholipid-binding lipoprotein MlaA